MMTCELFASITFAPESGLPESDTNHNEWSEQEEYRMDSVMTEIRQAFEEGRYVDPSRTEA